MNQIDYIDIIFIFITILVGGIIIIPLKVPEYFFERSPLIKLIGFFLFGLMFMFCFDFILFYRYGNSDIYISTNRFNVIQQFIGKSRILHLSMFVFFTWMEILMIKDLTRITFIQDTLTLQGFTEKEVSRATRKRKRQKYFSYTFGALWVFLIYAFGPVIKVSEAINKFSSNNISIGIPSELNIGIVATYFFYLFVTFQLVRYGLKLLEIRLRYTEQQQIDLSSINRAFDVIAIALSAIFALILVGANLQAVSIMAGLIAAGAAIALRELFGNFIAGLLLIWDDSIKKDNVISIQHDANSGGEVPYGWIHRITMRHTVIKDRNDIHLIIPNSILINKPIVNWSQDDSKVRIRLDLGLSYKDKNKLQLAKNIMISVALSEKRVLKDPRPTVNIMGLEDSYIHLQLRFYIIDPKGGIRNVKSNIYEGIIREFINNTLDFPHPQSDIHIKDISILEK
jgi:small-conductance mechanosensitive channel